MKTCPNCNEIIGDSAKTCFFCKYNYTLKRVLTSDEAKAESQNKQAETTQFYNNIKKEKEQIKQINKSILSLNPKYEYDVKIINDLQNGDTDADALIEIINTYANDGWRVHSIISNERGKTTIGVGIGTVMSGSNATIDQIVVLFERIIASNSNSNE